jgi:hypothetical protein
MRRFWSYFQAGDGGPFFIHRSFSVGGSDFYEVHLRQGFGEQRKLIDIGLCWFQRIFGILSGRLISGHWMV